MKALELKNIFKDFGKFKLGPLSFSIQKGKIHILVGPNGSGKTTTLKIIAGILKEDGGEIYLNGIKTDKNENFKKRVGFIQDEPFVYPYLSGIEQIFFIASFYGVKKEEARKKIEYFSKIFDMEEWINEVSKNYSQGMKQKINIVQSLIHEPEIILIDEPIISLDPKAIYNFKNYLKDLKRNKRGVLIATHSLEFADEMGDRIIFLRNGKIILEDEKEKLYKNYKTEKLEEIFIRIYTPEV